MLHVRVASPAALTEQLAGRLAAAYAPSFYVLLAMAALIGVALGISRRVRAEVRDGLLVLCGGAWPPSC